MKHLSEYKLQNRQEIRDLLEKPGFFEFAMQVYDYLELMKPGTVLVLDKYEEKYMNWAIKTTCLFIDAGDHWKEYEFNDTYTKVRRKEPWMPSKSRSNPFYTHLR